jgi:hypothetical protein
MSKFRFRVCRDYTKSIMVVVTAENIQEAHGLACGDPELFAEKDMGWDGNGALWQEDESNPSPAYTPDESDFEVIDGTWNARNQHESFTFGGWVTAIRMYKTELGYHDWVEEKIAEGEGGK